MRARGARRLAALLSPALLIGACSDTDPLPTEAGIGPDPVLPAPEYPLLPAMKLSQPLHWAANQSPTPAPGLVVTPFASRLDHPRWLLVLPNGDVLVAQSDSPGEIVKRPKDLIMGLAMRSVGSGKRKRHSIILLRDTDRDGIADVRSLFLDNLDSPFGMALVGDALYIAETSALRRHSYTPGALRLTGPGVKVTDLPGGPINHHWTKNVIASPDGARLYVTIGSNSNVGENGMAREHGRAAIWEIDAATGASRILASGLRNPVGLDWEPRTGALWTSVNERDEIGDDLVPDYITSVRRGGFYGWPYSYFGQNIDARAYPQRPDLVARAIKPDYAVGSHMGSLGLVFSRGTALGYGDGAFIAQHGSWNRSVPQGYRVIFVPFAGGKPGGLPQTVLDGFLARSGRSHGRPVGLAVDGRGGLLVADDQGNMVWRVAPLPATPMLTKLSVPGVRDTPGTVPDRRVTARLLRSGNRSRPAADGG